jgi:hypothetical protein
VFYQISFQAFWRKSQMKIVFQIKIFRTAARLSLLFVGDFVIFGKVKRLTSQDLFRSFMLQERACSAG